MEIKVELKYYSYLESYLKVDDEVLFHKFESSKITDNTFSMNSEIIDSIRDWAGEKLQVVGFNEDYSLTEQGRYLEDIIDIFYK